MALSMEEQRILAEMERNLAAEDPKLASRLGSFGQQRLPGTLKSQRVRTIAGLLALAMIAAVTITMFMLSPYVNGRRGGYLPRTSASASASSGTSATTQGATGSTGGQAGTQTGRTSTDINAPTTSANPASAKTVTAKTSTGKTSTGKTSTSKTSTSKTRAGNAGG